MTIKVPLKKTPSPGFSGERLKEESWVRERRPVWAVPSVIIPQELNIILFTEHKGFRADIVDIEKFSFDPRLINRLTAQ